MQRKKGKDSSSQKGNYTKQYNESNDNIKF